MSRHIDRARLFASALIGGGAVCAAALFAPVPASAKSMKECGAEYQAAKTAGTLNGETWQAFRSSHCSATATTPAATSAPGATAPAAAPAAAAPATTAATPVKSGKTMKECGAEYQAAKKGGTLNGETWQAFRASHCSAGGTAAAAPAVPATSAAAPAPATTAPAATPATTTAAAPAATATTAAGAVFPTAVSGKYSSLSAGKARMNTCLDQYKANKTGNGNGGLKWIQKGGGYYSECNKRLKGG